ncbi:methanol--corrinoid methyltransferase [archaeon]|nr:MAG: methanol--corrinoid methyltransferase [archaeon]
MVKRFTTMAYDDPDEMTFGVAKEPVKAGLGLTIGDGFTTPEINYAPRPETASSKEKLVKEYKSITTDIMDRMVAVGFPGVVLETEHVQEMTNNPEWGAAVAHAQKEIMEKYHDEYGINCALRHTPGDIREDRDYLRLREDKYDTLLKSFELLAENGVDMLSIESMGGKEVFDHAILRDDVPGVLFSIGCLGAMDMEYIWKDIVNIAKKHNVVPAGDTDCAQANTAMFVAGGLLDKNLAHTLAIIARAIAASRTLVAWECGATGPNKDCGYEGTILKSIGGRPITQEGKTSTCAHSDVMGNLVMQCCDLWSNESVEYHGEFGGTSVQAWGETLAYDCTLMNVALKTGTEKTLRDLFMLSDKYRDPQGYVLAYPNAWKVGRAIVEDGDDLYLRAKNAALETCNILEEGVNEGLKLTRFETKALRDAKIALEGLPDDQDTFISESLDKYKKEVRVFEPKRNYDL